jgi:hypothetical protein
MTSGVFGAAGLLEKDTKRLYRPGEVEHGLGQLAGDGVPAPGGVGRPAGQDPGVYDGELYAGAGTGVEVQVPERAAAGGGEPGGLVAGRQGLVQPPYPVVHLAGPQEGAPRPFGVPGLQDGGDLLEQGRELVEDRGDGPPDQTLRVRRQEKAHQ